MKLRLAALVLLAACGGKSAPAAAPAPSAPAAATCCCDYIKEEGDPEGDEWSENQTYEPMDAASCADLSGSCADAASCTAGSE